MKKCNVCDRTEETLTMNDLTLRTIGDNKYHICEECFYQSQGQIQSYLYKPNPKFWGKAQRHFGVEIETLPAYTTSYGKALAVGMIMKRTNGLVYIKRDGSVSQGFEIVTHPITFSQIKKAKSPFNFTGIPLSSFKHECTGIHVHVSRKGLTNLQLSKLVYFFSNPANEKFLTTLAQRDWNRYCKKHHKGEMKDTVAGWTDRYHALNFRNTHTVEFRFFKGNTKTNAIQRAVEFSNIILDFCRDTKAHGLTWEKFIEYVNNSTKYKVYFLRPFVNKFARDVKKQRVTV